MVPKSVSFPAMGRMPTQPSLLGIPFDAAEPPKPEFIIKGDLFHIMKTGCCRDVIGGVVVFLCRQSFFDDCDSTTNLPDRLTRAHGNLSYGALPKVSAQGFIRFLSHFLT